MMKSFKLEHKQTTSSMLYLTQNISFYLLLLMKLPVSCSLLACSLNFGAHLVSVHTHIQRPTQVNTSERNGEEKIRKNAKQTELNYNGIGRC